MSKIAVIITASAVPPVLARTGSRLEMSPPFSQVIVPPGWISARGAVLGGAVTDEMPPTGPLATFDFNAVVLLDVPALTFAVVVVARFPLTTGVDVVDSDTAVPWSESDVGVASEAAVVVVVSMALVAFLLPPPQPAATSDATATTTPARMRMARVLSMFGSPLGC